MKLKVRVELRPRDYADVYLDETFIVGPLLRDEARMMIRDWLSLGEIEYESHAAFPLDEPPPAPQA